jgi:ABC-2 type transport system ATP-binding protein
MTAKVGPAADDPTASDDQIGAMKTRPIPEAAVSSISFHQLTKRYGEVTALDDFTADVAPGRITAFLGPNGSGKTTSMRLLLGLAEPTHGSALIGGRPYASLEHPLRIVGAVLDQGFHPNRSARNHLRITAMQAGVPESRVDDVLDVVELTSVAGRRVGGFSLGMRQRLALASALIGDPAVLVMDEPFNGLDPAGIQTMRHFLRQFANDGGTVFLSSHLLAEVAHSADDAIIINHGHLVTAGPIASLMTDAPQVVVSSPDVEVLSAALRQRGATVESTGPDQITVSDAAPEFIGRTAMEVGAVIVEMGTAGDDLESIFDNLIHPKERTS